MAIALVMALALMAPADVAEAPISTAAEASAYPPGAPTDDYGFVAWCYGALQSHMALHDEAMPEVERIERSFERSPGSSTREIAAYEEQQIEGVRSLAQFRRAMEAAEKASARPIQPLGVAAIQKGQNIWIGAARADKRRLAQEWMSWALPEKCSPVAKQLEARASVLGQALSFNVKPAEEAAPAASSIDELLSPSEPAEVAETPSLRGPQ